MGRKRGALHARGPVGGGESASAGVCRSLDIGGALSWSLNVGRTLRRPLDVGRALSRPLNIGGTLRRPLDVRGPLSTTATTACGGCLTKTVCLDGRGSRQQGDDRRRDEFRAARFHGYSAEVNLIGPSFGIGTPPLSRL
jgi:hypothetical protein